MNHRDASDDYLPIAEHGLIGDLHTAALVGTEGTIDWYCTPRFDSASVFGAILDAQRGGSWRIRPEGCVWTSRQLYQPDTNLLLTRFLSEDGVGELLDFMPVAESGGVEEPHELVRIVRVVRGRMRFRMDLAPRFDYGRVRHELEVVDGGAVFRSPELTLAVTSRAPLERSERDVHLDTTLNAGEQLGFVLGEAEGRALHPVSEAEIDALAIRTAEFWRRWIGRSRYHGRWREMVNRSALTLKLLTYGPTGAIVAAPTTSLPEQLGGGRNWDYRFTWIRDASFTLHSLLLLGFTSEAGKFMDWLTDRFKDGRGAAEGPLQIMYRIDGDPELGEVELGHLEGYRGSAPVRIGNGAAGQVQMDIYGEMIDSVYVYDRFGSPIYHDTWPDLRRVVDWLVEHWATAGEGIWETRGGRKNFTYGRLMTWVAFDRAVRMALSRGRPGDVSTWMSVRDEIYHEIYAHGWSERRRSFVQAYENEVLDAALLQMPFTDFVAPTDPRWRTTLDAIRDELVSDSLVYRYDVSASPDGLEGREGTFSICSFWWVEALSRAHRADEARYVFEKMLTHANHVGLFAEQIGLTGEQLGNFPQAFTHLALISARDRPRPAAGVAPRRRGGVRRRDDDAGPAAGYRPDARCRDPSSCATACSPSPWPPRCASTEPSASTPRA